MRDYNTIVASLACPHCSSVQLLRVKCRLGYTADRIETRVGDPYPWAPAGKPEKGLRRADGRVEACGYTECTSCKLDFFTDVDVSEGRIAAVTASVAKPGFKTAPVPGGIRYFAAGELYPDDVRADYFARCSYSRHLGSMGEPSLILRGADCPETYRFLWLRTFHRPIAVRVAKLEEGCELLAVELDGKGGYEPGSIARTIPRTLGEASWVTLLTQLELMGFWELPPSERQLGTDGADWVLEGVKAGTHRVVHRWCPKGPVRDTGLLFLSLAWIHPEDTY